MSNVTDIHKQGAVVFHPPKERAPLSENGLRSHITWAAAIRNVAVALGAMATFVIVAWVGADLYRWQTAVDVGPAAHLVHSCAELLQNDKNVVYSPTAFADICQSAVHSLPPGAH